MVHPYDPATGPPTPEKDGETSRAAAYRNKWSQSLGLASIGEEPAQSHGNPYEVVLDIGDEFFAFEEYRVGTEQDGAGELWYRG